MKLLVFWFQAVCKTVLWPFFSLVFTSLFKSRICFLTRVLRFGARYCVFIGLFNFSKGSQLIFHDALGFFVIHERFFNDKFRFLVVKTVF